MTLEEEIIIKDFKTRIRQLLARYQQMRDENMHLQEEVKQLKDTIKIATAEKTALKEDYDKLKTAKMIDISNEDLARSKRRIDKLVHKIDKCIALLNI